MIYSSRQSEELLRCLQAAQICDAQEEFIGFEETRQGSGGLLRLCTSSRL